MIQYIGKIIAGIFGNDPDNNYFSGYMMKNSIRLFMLQGFSLALGFLSNYILIQLAGVNIYGSYVYIFNLLYLLSGFCIFGMDTLLVKKVSVYDADGKFSKLKGVILFAIGIAIAGSIIITIVSEFIIRYSGITKKFSNINWVILAFPVLLMLSISLINQASLQGLRKVFLSQLTEKALRPLLILLGIVIFFYSRKEITLEEMVWINVTGISVAMLITSFLHKKSIGFKIKNIKAKYHFSGWSNSAFSFFIAGIFYVLNSRVNIFFLGLLKGNGEVGIYNIILKISEAIGFVLITTNFVLAPVIAKLFSNGEILQMQRLITRSAKIVLLISFPVLLAILVFNRDILLFFGYEFLDGQQALLILCGGQLINILSGSVGLLLMMTGNQRFSIYSLAIST
ncbi:MAG: oligosaccharide flippase family protein, partial [Bacteroidia bacterium]|nr:oligosaccharide flippase family protein [Bacteroidia bacterium]